MLDTKNLKALRMYDPDNPNKRNFIIEQEELSKMCLFYFTYIWYRWYYIYLLLLYLRSRISINDKTSLIIIKPVWNVVTVLKIKIFREAM